MCSGCVARQYNQYKTPMENIGLQDSLLSRFDLLFIVLDIVSNLVDICGNGSMSGCLQVWKTWKSQQIL